MNFVEVVVYFSDKAKLLNETRALKIRGEMQSKLLQGVNGGYSLRR